MADGKKYLTIEEQIDYLKTKGLRISSVKKAKKYLRGLGYYGEQKNKQKSVQHYSEKYGYYPFWVVANILSFGTISHLYAKMKQPDQNEISLSLGVKPDFLESALIIMHLFRNACAHNEVTYNFKTRYSLKQKEIVKIYELFGIEATAKNGRYECGVNDLFCITIIFKLLLTKGHFLDFFSQFLSILKKLESKVSERMFKSIISAMGVPADFSKLKTLKSRKTV